MVTLRLYLLVFIAPASVVLQTTTQQSSTNYKNCFQQMTTFNGKSCICCDIFKFMKFACVQIFNVDSELKIVTSSSTARFILPLIGAISDRPQLINQFKENLSKKTKRSINHGALQALQTLLTYWRRFNVTIFVDYSIDISSSAIKLHLKLRGINAVVHQMTKISKNEISSRIKRIKHCAVLFDTQHLPKFIEIANELKLFSNEMISWIFITTNEMPTVWSKINQLRSQINVLTPQHYQKVNIDEFILKFNVSRQSKMKTQNVPVECQKSKSNLSKTIKISITNHVSEIMSGVRNMSLYDVFHSNQSKQNEMLQLGRWSFNKGLKFFTNLRDIDPSRGLRGRRINIITFEEQPYLFVNNGSKGPWFSGYLYHVLITVTQYLNMQPKIIISPTAATGIEMSPGNYTGVVGILFRRESDLALASLGMTVSRRPAIRFSAPVITEMYLSIFVRRPRPEISYTSYFDVFSCPLWLASIFFVVFAMAAITLVAYQQLHIGASYNTAQTLYWFFSGLFYEQVINSARMGKASKIVVGAFLLTTVVLLACYTTALTSFLIYQIVKLPFQNMEELVYQNPNYRIILVTGTNHYDHFRNSKLELYAKVWQKVSVQRRLQDVVTDVTEGLEKIKTGKFAFFGDGPSGKYLSRNDNNVTFLHVNYFNEFSHFPMRMDYPYIKLFSSVLLKMNENGVLDILSRRYFPFLQKRSSLVNKSNTLGLHQVVTPFMILVAGIISCVIAFTVELFVFYKKQTQLEK